MGGGEGGGGEGEKVTEMIPMRRREGEGETDRNDCHELHNDVERRCGRVLEWITYGMTHNSNSMHIRFLSSIPATV